MDEYNQLLAVLAVQIQHEPCQPFEEIVGQLESVLRRLRVYYVTSGAPYGDDEQGFQRWLRELWPTPPTA